MSFELLAKLFFHFDPFLPPSGSQKLGFLLGFVQFPLTDFAQTWHADILSKYAGNGVVYFFIT